MNIGLVATSLDLKFVTSFRITFISSELTCFDTFRANKLSKKITKFIMFGFCAYYPLRMTNLLVKHYLLRLPPQLFLQSSWIPPIFASSYALGLLYQVLTSLCAGFTNASYNCFIIYLTIHVSMSSI